MIGGMMNTAMIVAVAYARRGVYAATSPAKPPSSPATSSPWAMKRGTAPISAWSPVAGSAATSTRPTNRMMYGESSTISSATMSPPTLARA